MGFRVPPASRVPPVSRPGTRERAFWHTRDGVSAYGATSPRPGDVGVRGGVLLGRPRSLLRPRPEVDLRERPIFGAPPNAVRSLAIQLLAPDSMALPAAHAVTARDTQRHRETAAVLPIYRPLAEKHPDEHEQSSSEDHDCEPCPGTTRRRQHEDDRSDNADGYGEGRELTEVATY